MFMTISVKRIFFGVVLGFFLLISSLAGISSASESESVDYDCHEFLVENESIYFCVDNDGNIFTITENGKITEIEK